MKSVVLAAYCLSGAVALAAGLGRQAPKTPATKGSPMDTLAERYVKLVLAMGQHDADYVDAYYGPPEWRKESEAGKRPLDQIDTEAAALQQSLGAAAPAIAAEEMLGLRHTYLTKQVSALRARIAMLSGGTLTF